MLTTKLSTRKKKILSERKLIEVKLEEAIMDSDSGLKG
jgi:hypothetical protein